MKEQDNKQEIKENIVRCSISEIVPERFLEYAMYVIKDRALPDVRDGLKPVHRRILYSMNELGVSPNKPYKKSARTVGDVLGKFHPHGDTSVYEAMVILAQEFSTRYPLIDGHGNFGSLDGDPAAAMRYTESRLSRYGQALMNDIHKNTVDFKPNYDQEELEPTVLSNLIPNMLINGSFGIAVGMGNKIPSHNISDVYRACYTIIDNTLNNKETTDDEVIKAIKAPDFATGGTIIGMNSVIEGYKTGRGRIIIRSKYEIETDKKGRESIIISEIPYGVNKQKLIEHINDLSKEEKNSKGQIVKISTFPQIREIRDESDKDGVRIVIELKQNESSQIVINNLIKYTKFQNNFGMNMITIVDGNPVSCNLLHLLEQFLAHAAAVIVRRSEFELENLEKRLNIVDGILKCTESEESINKVIEIIRFSDEVVNDLIAIGFNEVQAKYISEMKIKSLSNASKDKLTTEASGLRTEQIRLKDIINDDFVLLRQIKSEFQALEDLFKDERRTEISYSSSSIEEEDLIKEETLIVTYTTDSIIKAVEESEYKSQKRGGKGVKATNTKEDEIIKFMFTTSSKDDLLFFTTEGRCHVMKAYKIGKSSKIAKGKSINNYLNLNVGEKIVSVLNTNIKNKNNFLFMITKKGQIKKLSLEQLSNRFAITKVIGFKDDDHLVQALLVEPEDSVLLATQKGLSTRIDTDAIRASGRGAMGVIGLNLADNDNVVDMSIVKDDDYVLTITELGIAKRTKANSWSIQAKGGKGKKAHDISDKTGDLSAILTIEDNDELFIATEKGQITRISVKDIRVLSRTSKGVKAINLNLGDKIASVSINRNLDNNILEEEETEE